MASRPKPRPVTDADRAEILRRHAAGESRNAIAKALGRSGETVSKAVAAAGLSFERGPEVIAATTAKLTDLAAARVELAHKFHEVAVRELDGLTERTKYWDWGGAEHDYDVQWQDKPHAADRRSMIQAASTAAASSLKLVPPVDDTGAEAAKSMLGALADGIRSYIGTDDAPAEEDTGEG
jgi:hypothetical protein